MTNNENTAKIKVVHIITKLELGGAQINTIYTYENLDPQRFEAHLFSGDGGILTDRLHKKDHFHIVPDLVRSINPVKDFKAFRQVRRLLRKIKPDIVHTHSSKAGIIGRAAAFSLRVPVIIHSVHGFSFSPFQSFLKRSFFLNAERLVKGITSHFIFVSQDDMDVAREKDLVRSFDKGVPSHGEGTPSHGEGTPLHGEGTPSHGNAKENCSLIRSGFPFEAFLETGRDKKALRKKYGIGADDLIVGIIAPFKPQKGLFHLVEIAAKVLAEVGDKKNVVFMITGDGALREPLEAALKEKGILQNFRLPGFIFDIPEAVDIFDIGVSTALWEGLPQSLVQLRLMKKAVVASDICGNREVITDGQNGFLVEVSDYTRFAQQVVRLIEDDALRSRLAAFDENFSQWDARFMVKEQETLYRKLLNRS
ncbi:MAG: glycosyltransferase family 4 protein [bacterium]|nr:glycosyltransferase family 4 protein [bacterium]